MIDVMEKMREFNQLIEDQRHKGVGGYIEVLDWVGKFKQEMHDAIESGNRPFFPADMMSPLSQTLRETALKGMMSMTERAIQGVMMAMVSNLSQGSGSGRKWSCEK